MQTQLNQSKITIFFSLDKNYINESKNKEAKEKKEASPFSRQERSKRKKKNYKEKTGHLNPEKRK